MVARTRIQYLIPTGTVQALTRLHQSSGKSKGEIISEAVTLLSTILARPDQTDMMIEIVRKEYSNGIN